MTDSPFGPDLPRPPVLRQPPRRERLISAEDSFLGSDKPPRKKPVNLGPRTVAALEAEGWRVAKAQSYNAYSGRSTDMFGFLDYIAIKPGRTLGVQVCTHSAAAPHISKAKNCEDFLTWLDGRELEFWGWHKPGRLWECVKRIVTIDGNGNIAVEIIASDKEFRKRYKSQILAAVKSGDITKARGKKILKEAGA